MERYEAYKDSGVEWIGKIPAGWAINKLGNLGQYINGYAFKPQQWGNTGLPIIRIQDLTGSNESPNYYDGVIDSKYLIGHGDLLVSWAATIGVFWWKGKHGWLNQHIFRVLPYENICDKRFFFWLLNAAIDALNHENKHGIMMEHLTLAVFNAFRVPMPSLTEQIAIADYLETKTRTIDGLIAGCEREVELLQEYRKSVISEAVTKGLDPTVPMKDSGIEWIGEIPENCQVVPLKHLITSIESGKSIDGASWPPSEDEKGVLTLSAVYQSHFDYNQNKAVLPSLYDRLSCHLKRGTLLISRCNTSEWVGTAAYVSNAPNNLYLPDKLWQLSFADDYRCRYIQYALQSNSSRSYFAALSVGASSTMQNIAKSDLLAVPIALPSHETIAAIVKCLDTKTAEIDGLIADKQTMADKLREYRKSLISEAVTGKFKVPGI